MSLPRLRYNIAALGGLQIASYLIPLITLPFLSRVLGLETFGKVAFAQIIVAYLILVTDYGFSWSTSRKISANRNNVELVSSLFISSWAAQWLLVTICGLSLFIAVNNIPMLRENGLIYAAGFLFVIGNALFPLWLLQGLERMREVAIIQVTTRIIIMIFILVLLRNPEDGELYMLISGAGQIIAGILCIFWINKKNLIIWKQPTTLQIKIALQDGFSIFGSKLSISLYTTLIPLTLGIVAGNAALANFAMADKIRLAAQSIVSPISQALFPRMSHLYAHDTDAANRLLSLSLTAVLLINVPIALMLWFGANYIVLLLGGVEFSQSANVLRWLALVPLLVGLSNLYGVQVLLAKGLTKIVNFTAFTVGIFAACLIYPMTLFYQANGAALTIFLAEAVVAGVYFLYVKNFNILKTQAN